MFSVVSSVINSGEERFSGKVFHFTNKEKSSWEKKEDLRHTCISPDLENYYDKLNYLFDQFLPFCLKNLHAKFFWHLRGEFLKISSQKQLSVVIDGPMKTQKSILGMLFPNMNELDSSNRDAGHSSYTVKFICELLLLYPTFRKVGTSYQFSLLTRVLQQSIYKLKWLCWYQLLSEERNKEKPKVM